MEKTFDGIVDGKHIERWEMTVEEKEAAKKRLEELKNKKKTNNDDLHKKPAGLIRRAFRFTVYSGRLP